MATVKVTTVKAQLLQEHATAAAFLDETGAIAQDRFFAVGCLVLPEPADVLRKVQKLRDKAHWYDEIKWVDLTRTSEPLYRDLVDIVATSNGRFSCFVADRDAADPVARFKQDAWLAYQKLATQLLIGTSKPHELLSVMADRSAKAALSKHVLNAYGVRSTLGGCKTDKLNVAIYRNPLPKRKLSGLVDRLRARGGMGRCAPALRKEPEGPLTESPFPVFDS